MSINKFFVLTALTLALLAALVGEPDRSDRVVNDLAASIENENDHIAAETLAVWIEESKQVRIIDLRDSVSFSDYHIPGAEMMPLTALVHGGVQRNETIVLYSEGGIHSAQAWTLLKTKRFPNVFTIRGGLGAWKSDVLFPILQPNASEKDKTIFETRRKLSLFFGGSPKIIPDEQKNVQPKQRLPAPKKIKLPKFQKEEDRVRDTC